MPAGVIFSARFLFERDGTAGEEGIDISTGHDLVNQEGIMHKQQQLPEPALDCCAPEADTRAKHPTFAASNLFL